MIESQIYFCEKYGIDPNELMLLEILLMSQEDNSPETVHKYFTLKASSRGLTIELLKNLQRVGIISKTYQIPEKGTVFDPKSVPINKNVIKDFYKHSFEMGKELWDAYPQFGYVNGNSVGLKSVSKKFDTIEDCFRFYGKQIGWKADTHNHIIELINWANEHDIINCTLANFIVDHKWEELEALKEGGSTNYDAIKIV